jgi:transcriptional regulator with XRE-family HTH domain
MNAAQETLGQYLRRLRKARGLTGQAVVDATGIGNSTLTYYEQDQSLPSPPLLEKVAQFLGGDLEYVWALWLKRAGVQHIEIPQLGDNVPYQPSLPEFDS